MRGLLGEDEMRDDVRGRDEGSMTADESSERSGPGRLGSSRAKLQGEEEASHKQQSSPNKSTCWFSHSYEGDSR